MSNILKYQNPSSPLLIQRVNQSGANFVKRLLDPNRKSIPDWETKGQKIATHKMSWGEDEHGAYVFPEVQEIDGQLIDFSRPPYAPGMADYMAHKNNNIIRMSPEEADWFTRNYKQYYPSFKKGGRIHIKKKNRGKFTEYCGGKVTEECIARGKRSKNPLTRRRANFASVVRKWKHENGGILKAQNSAKLPGYVQYNGSDLSDIETFNKNWLNYRNSQLANQGWKDESIKNKLNWFQRNFGASDKTVANLVREQLFSNLDNTKELSFSDALKDSQGRYLLTESMYADFPGERELHEVEIGPPKPVEDWKLDYSFNGSVGGTHYPDFNTIIYNDLYQNTPIKIHERDHAMFGKYNDKNIGLRIVENIFKQDFLDNVSDKWGYYDDPGEIRARLMQMRYNNQLDPKHKYTLEEIENMRNNPTFIDEHIFDRYTNKYIEYLLNDVAQNNMNENRLDYRSPINFAKDGGILKAQGGTGNLYAPHPLSPVGIALNQAKAMAKMKGEQHLPPGVKEVVGPDGKKVAIRTEQPLVPLEQSIAEWLPGTGDVAEAGYIANDVKNGNLGSAALAAAMVALPGNVGKIFRKSDIPTSKLTEAERLGIPKGERSNPKALDNPQYWGYEQWNGRYNAAVRAGNWEEVQRLRDLHFITKAPNTKIVDKFGMLKHMYHGSPKHFTEFVTSWNDIDEFDKFNLFTNRRKNRNAEIPSKFKILKTKALRPVDDELRAYFTPDYNVAKNYKDADRRGIVYDTYLNIENPYPLDDQFWTDFDGSIKETVMKIGHDGMFIPKYAKSIVPLNTSAQIKLADPITWNGRGEIVPIVKRDNFRNIDIRYNNGGKL